jgi:hypothetical protein
MSIRLDPTERRIIGCLIEKQLTTPDQYPLTLNALVLGCNQKVNREPTSDYREHEIQGALRALMDRGWVAELERAGGRTVRYAHQVPEQLSVDEADLAILAELLLRGPQSSTELNTRASRMRPLRSPEAVEAKLQALAARPVPYVEFMGRRPGERVPRWKQLLSPESAGAGVPESPSSSPAAPVPSRPPSTAAPHAATAPNAPAAPYRPSPVASVPAPAPSASALADLEARVERLERTVAEMRAALGA